MAKAESPSLMPTYTLDSLLGGVTPENLHAEVPVSPPLAPADPHDPCGCTLASCVGRSDCRHGKDFADARREARLQHAPKMRPPLKTAPTPPATPARQRLIDTDSATRKTFPMVAGLLDYFPDALAAVAAVSRIGNEKHNPGEEMHHARGKSMDHADCIVRHLVGRGGFDGDARESAALAWRALALLQEELEREMSLPLPRGARAASQ
jgi:hypothetical protein